MQMCVYVWPFSYCLWPIECCSRLKLHRSEMGTREPIEYAHDRRKSAENSDERSESGLSGTSTERNWRADGKRAAFAVRMRI